MCDTRRLELPYRCTAEVFNLLVVVIEERDLRQVKAGHDRDVHHPELLELGLDVAQTLSGLRLPSLRGKQKREVVANTRRFGRCPTLVVEFRRELIRLNSLADLSNALPARSDIRQRSRASVD